MSDADTIRRIADRGLSLAQKEGPAFIDLFQRLLDEIQRCDIIPKEHKHMENNMSLTLLEAAAAKIAGKRVEVYYCDDWIEWNGTCWSNDWTVRIAPEPKKKVKMDCWLVDHRLVWVTYEAPIGSKWKRVPAEDKIVEIEIDN